MHAGTPVDGITRSSEPVQIPGKKLVTHIDSVCAWALKQGAPSLILSQQRTRSLFSNYPSPYHTPRCLPTTSPFHLNSLFIGPPRTTSPPTPHAHSLKTRLIQKATCRRLSFLCLQEIFCVWLWNLFASLEQGGGSYRAEREAAGEQKDKVSGGTARLTGDARVCHWWHFPPIVQIMAEHFTICMLLLLHCRCDMLQGNIQQWLHQW